MKKKLKNLKKKQWVLITRQKGRMKKFHELNSKFLEYESFREMDKMDPLSLENIEQRMEGFGKWMHKETQIIIPQEDKSMVLFVNLLINRWQKYTRKRNLEKEEELDYTEELLNLEDQIQNLIQD